MKTTITKNALPHVAAMSLALGTVLASWSLPAAALDTWVSTQTQAFLPQVQANTDERMSLSAASARLAVAVKQGESVHVVLSLNLRNEAELDQYLQALQQPGNGSFGKFLTPEQFTARYAASDAQVAAVVAHLSKSGFVNIEVSANRQLVSADGTAATVQTGFRTTLKRFTHEGRSVYANTEAAQVPPALGAIVGSVLGLQDVTLATTHHRIVTPSLSAATHALNQSQVALDAAAVAVPHNPVEFSALYNAGATPTASQTTVGIIAEGNVSQTLIDLQTFTSRNGLAPISTGVVRSGPAGSTYEGVDGVGEWNLDSQSIVGAAGGAVKKLVFYVAPSMQFSAITAAYNRAVTDNVAKVINVSLGGCEADTYRTGTQAADNKIFKQAVAQGQTFSVSTGDAGTYNCSVSRISGVPGVPKRSTYDVSEPASSPYVIAVGGTTLYTSGGAYSNETVWNEGLSAIGRSDPTLRLWATGGGFSKYETAPRWQAGITGNASRRGLPDVAFDAAGSSGASIIVEGETQAIGGTSLSAPIFTGIWARLQSANNNRLGFPAASLYQYLPSNPALLRDVTSGNNGSGGYGYDAKAGWDATTGFGSLNIEKLHAFIKKTPDFAR